MKKQFDHETVTVTFTYTNEIGETLTYSETVNIEESFPTAMDIVARSMECFLRNLGELADNDILFIDKMSEHEFETVTEDLAEMRGGIE